MKNWFLFFIFFFLLFCWIDKLGSAPADWLVLDDLIQWCIHTTPKKYRGTHIDTDANEMVCFRRRCNTINHSRIATQTTKYIHSRTGELSAIFFFSFYFAWFCFWVWNEIVAIRHYRILLYIFFLLHMLLLLQPRQSNERRYTLITDVGSWLCAFYFPPHYRLRIHCNIYYDVDCSRYNLLQNCITYYSCASYAFVRKIY